MAKDADNVTIIKTIAFAAKDTSPASICQATTGGGGYDATWSGDWSALDVYMAADEVAVKPRKDDTKIWPAELPSPVRHYITKAGIESITFALDEVGGDAYEFATDLTYGSNTITQGTETMQSVAIEYRGLGVLWLPNAAIDWTGGPDGGLQSQSKLSLTITPFGSTSSDYGWEFIAFSGA